jgi:hypothetical protein
MRIHLSTQKLRRYYPHQIRKGPSLSLMNFRKAVIERHLVGAKHRFEYRGFVYVPEMSSPFGSARTHSAPRLSHFVTMIAVP